MAGKRQATSNLNHENWDQEEEPEERGTFRKATEDELKNRVIKKARRKVATGNSGVDATDDGAPKSVFSGFAGFGKSTNATAAGSPFSFLSKVSASTADASSTPTTTKPSFSFGTAIKSPPTVEKEDKTSAKNGNAVKEIAKEGKGKSTSYQNKIKSLNEAVTEWIKTHVEKNPLCILTPIFKDYDKYLKEIEEEEQKSEPLKTDDSASVKNTSSDTPTDSQTLGNFKFSAFSKPSTSIASTSGTGALFSFSSTPSSSATVPTSSSSIFTKPTTEAPKQSTFSFGIKPAENKNNATDGQTSSPSPSKGFSFGLKTDNKPSTSASSAFTFGKPATNGDSSDKKPNSFSFTPGSTPFSFGNIKPPTDPAPSTSADANGADDEEDQPPKVEFKQVVEEDAVYSKKCKVFVKKDGAFTDRGVGTLYLKPVKDSEKTQLLVRADTNLGNILVNLILSAGIPTQRMGKNNVMMVCLPTPDVEKATSMLLRVKTADEADDLLAELEKHKK